MNLTRSSSIAFAAFLAVPWVIAIPSLSFAQDRAATEQPSAAPKRSEEALDLDQYGAKGVITGSEHMPDFTVLIDRENLSRAFDLDLEERFLPKIIEAVGREPF